MSDKTQRQSITENEGSRVRKRRDNPLDDVLVKGEEVIVEGRIHVGIYWQTVVVFVFSIVLAFFLFPLGVLLAIVAICMFAYNTMRKSIFMLVLTNKRVLVRYGILQIDVVDMRFDKIESVELERMLPGYLMGYANVIIMGTGNRYVAIPYVENAREFRQAYNRMTLKDEDPQEVVVVDKGEG